MPPIESPVTAMRPFALNAQLVTVSRKPPWPLDECNTSHLVVFHSRTVSSADPVSAIRPSALRAQQVTSAVWPFKMPMSLPSRLSQAPPDLSVALVPRIRLPHRAASRRHRARLRRPGHPARDVWRCRGVMWFIEYSSTKEERNAERASSFQSPPQGNNGSWT